MTGRDRLMRLIVGVQSRPLMTDQRVSMLADMTDTQFSTAACATVNGLRMYYEIHGSGGPRSHAMTSAAGRRPSCARSPHPPCW
jgi:hypothetical protein